MADYVPFHRAITQGAKRGLSRATRFIYLELSLAARSFEGRLPLPRGFKTDLDAVHDIIGGNRREVASALSDLTSAEAGDEPMIALEGPPSARVLVIKSFDRWARGDVSTPRVRRFRERRSEESQDVGQDSKRFVPVSETRDETPQRRGEERREENKKEEPPVVPRGDETVSESKGKKTPKGAHALPANWQPPQSFWEWVTSKRYARADVERCVEDMALWALAKGARKADWVATLQGWVNREAAAGKVEIIEVAAPTRGLRDIPTPEELASVDRSAVRAKLAAATKSLVAADPDLPLFGSEVGS